MITFKETLNEGVMEVKNYFISKGIKGYKDTPEDKARFTNDVKAAGIGNSNDAGKAWKSFQATKEIFAPGKGPETKEVKKIIISDSEVKALEKSWADVKIAYDKAAKLSGDMYAKVRKDSEGIEVHIKNTPDLYAVLKGLEMSKPSEDFSKRLGQIIGFVGDVIRHYKKV